MAEKLSREIRAYASYLLMLNATELTGKEPFADVTDVKQEIVKVQTHLADLYIMLDRQKATEE